MANKRRKKKNPKKKFFTIVFSILSVYCIFLLGFFVYAHFSGSRGTDEGNSGFIGEIVNKIAPLPERTIALVGVTEKSGTLIDGIMIVSYNSVNNKISILSVPRDTRAYIYDDDMYSVMQENSSGLRAMGEAGRTMKINAIGTFGGERKMEFLQEYLENMLDIKIDYNALLSLDSVEYIVDSIGGVEFDVPERMYYSDPDQDLLIDIQPGLQTLDGEQAVHLMRYRTDYKLGDIQRIGVQHQFMNAFFEKALSAEAILSNPSAYLTLVTEQIETNFGISDGLKYISEIEKINLENLETVTLEGTFGKEEGLGEIVIIDEDKAKEVAYQMFKTPTIDPKDIVYEDSFDKTIKILNGSGKGGMASDTKEFLEAKGYTIAEIGTSTESIKEETIIYVSRDGYGSDLQKLFTNAKVVTNPIKAQDLGADIVVVSGRNSEFIK